MYELQDLITHNAAREALAFWSKQFIIIYVEYEYNLDSAALLVFCGSCKPHRNGKCFIYLNL